MTKAIALVAHPDDCVIFAYHFINAHPEFEWEIVYMTYSLPDKRAEEMEKFWGKRNIPVKFLAYYDNPMDIETGQCSIDLGDLISKIDPVIVGAGLLLTHGESGEYGHPHHMVIHRAVEHLTVPKIFFASGHDSNLELSIPKDLYSLDELPEHKFVIEMFNDRDRAWYNVTNDALKLL